MPKRYYKYKLLLDENLAPRHFFPLLNERYDVKHIRDHLHLEGISDNRVYDEAVKLGRVPLTYNVKHFKPLVGKRDDSGIIGLPPNVSEDRLDKKIVALLSRTAPTALRRRYVSLSAEEDQAKQ